MSKPLIVFSTLYPKDVKVQKALDNTNTLLKTSNNFHKDVDVIVEAGSAYPESCVEVSSFLHKSFPEIASRSEVVHCPFELTHEMTERRGHEISFSKRFLMERQIERKAADRYLVFLDSDLEVDFKFILKGLLMLMEDDASFVQIPYVLRDHDSTPPDQLGAFIVPTLRLDKEAAETIYQTAYTEMGKLRRIGAPDCRLFRHFLKTMKKIRLDQCTTLHYAVDQVAIYDHGTIRRESW